MANLDILADKYLPSLSKTNPSASYPDLVSGADALVRATGLTLAPRGVLSFGTHLSSAKFAVTYPGVVKEPKPVNSVAPTPDMENYSNLLKDYDHKLARRVLLDSLVLFLVSSLIENPFG